MTRTLLMAGSGLGRIPLTERNTTISLDLLLFIFKYIPGSTGVDVLELGVDCVPFLMH